MHHDIAMHSLSSFQATGATIFHGQLRSAWLTAACAANSVSVAEASVTADHLRIVPSGSNDAARSSSSIAAKLISM